MAKKAALYVHGKGGSAAEAERYGKNCAGFDVIGIDYDGRFPWTAQSGIRAAYDAARERYESISLIANSIGAYFAMLALHDRRIVRALFISPVLDLERLIQDMMRRAGVTERDLREKGEIPADGGETLSWEYLQFVREHPIAWNVPTEILHAKNAALISRQTVDSFVRTHDARLTVMENGEHWFHTEAQLAVLDAWMAKAIKI